MTRTGNAGVPQGSRRVRAGGDGRDGGGDKHDGCGYFVLDLDHDPHAIRALQAYANAARADGYEALADDLDATVRPLPGEQTDG